jgi:hypothetical protein
MITVVIPVRDRPIEVVAAIDSLLGQQADVEIIVVDDGSSDSTARAVRTRVGDSVRLIQQRPQGVCAARNAGVAQASHDWVSFLDSDDLSAPGALEFFARARLSGGADIASGSALLRHPDGSQETLRPQTLGPAFGDIRARLLAGCFAIDRALLLEAGGFTPGLRYSEHTDLGLRLGHLAASRPIHTVTTDEVVALLNGRSTAVTPELRLESALAILERNHDQLRRSTDLYVTYLAIAGVSASRTGDRKLALSMLGRAIRARPSSARNWLRFARAALS